MIIQIAESKAIKIKRSELHGEVWKNPWNKNNLVHLQKLLYRFL